MPSLSEFSRFFAETGPTTLTGPNAVINDAQLRNYGATDMLSKAKRELKGGNRIQDFILFDDPMTASTYKPGDNATASNPQSTDKLVVDWRFIRTPVSWNDKEISFNEGGGSEYDQFKSIRNRKWQEAETSTMNLFERLFYATPSNADMEASSGQEPYSLLASVTSDGLAPAGFTTVQGINPTTKTKWRNQTATYDVSATFDQEAGLLSGFDTIAQLVNFRSPMLTNEPGKFSPSDMSKCVIHTNREGERKYRAVCRAANDYTRKGAQDPSLTSCVWDGVAVTSVDQLDTNGTFTAGSPGYLFYNMNFIKLVVHAGDWMKKGKINPDPFKPDTEVCWITSSCNILNQSRRRHGYLSAV